MLRICSLAGETLATFSADELEGKNVKLLKIALAKQTGVTRFRQRWLSENHTELHDDDVVPCCDVQLVVLPFVPAKTGEIRQLLSACWENHPDELIDLLQKPLNPKGVQEIQGFLAALRFAAQNGHSQIVQLLLEAGIDINIADDDKDDDGQDEHYEHFRNRRTALHEAAGNGHLEVVTLLLEAGAHKDAVDCSGRTALHDAAMRGHSEVVKLLLEASADKDAADICGTTALHMAFYRGHSEIVKLLLEAGAKTDAVALIAAAQDYHGDSEMVNLLPEASADKDPANIFGTTALHKAAYYGHSEIVKLLLEASADKDAADFLGTTALHKAAYYGHSEIVKLLLEAGVNTDAANFCGETALHEAAKKGDSQIVQLLLEAGADAHIVNDAYRYLREDGDYDVSFEDENDHCHDGRTALHFAAEKGHLEVVKLLLEAGAHKDAADRSGLTALHVAVDVADSEMVELLLQAGAHKDVKDSKNRLPLDLARARGVTALVPFLQPEPQT